MRKKVILKFIGTGIGKYYQAYVEIYNKQGDIVFFGKTYNGIVELYLENKSVYKIVALLRGRIIRNVFYVNDYDEKYVFWFKNIIRNNGRTITFFLKDANYNNLPIEKGEMFLWQKQ